MGKLEIHPGFWLLLILALTAGAGKVLPLVLMVALFHEMAHLGMLRLFGVRVQGARLSFVGAEIRADTRYLPYGKEILCVLAGPFVNIAMALVLARVAEDYLLAGASMLLGVYNLLPLPELDGGRALYLLVSWLLDPMRADAVCRWVGILLAAAFVLLVAVLSVINRTGIFLPVAVLGLLFPQLPLVKRQEKQ